MSFYDWCPWPGITCTFKRVTLKLERGPLACSKWLLESRSAWSHCKVWAAHLTHSSLMLSAREGHSDAVTSADILMTLRGYYQMCLCHSHWHGNSLAADWVAGLVLRSPRAPVCLMKGGDELNELLLAALLGTYALMCFSHWGDELYRRPS